MPNSDALLDQAIHLGKRDRDVFDWPDSFSALEKVQEELNELKEEMSQNDTLKINEEFSDLFFTLLQLARHLRIDPRNSLEFAIFKYSCRSEAMFLKIKQDQQEVSRLGPAELEKYWTWAKKKTQNEVKKKSSDYFTNKRPNQA